MEARESRLTAVVATRIYKIRFKHSGCLTFLDVRVKLGVPYPDVLTIVVRTLVQTWIPCSLFMEALRASPSRPGRKNLGSGGTVTQYRGCNSFNRDNIGTTKGIKGVMLCNVTVLLLIIPTPINQKLSDL